MRGQRALMMILTTAVRYYLRYDVSPTLPNCHINLAGHISLDSAIQTLGLDLVCGAVSKTRD